MPNVMNCKRGLLWTSATKGAFELAKVWIKWTRLRKLLAYFL
jgi:hypothetical protein